MRTAADGRVWGVKGYPVFDNEGEVVNVIQIASDLSEKMQLRKEAARAAHLAALGGLSAGIAHEINNPTGLVLMALPFVKDAMQDLLPLTDDYVEQNPGLQIAGLPYETFREEILQTIEDMQGGAQRVKRIVEDLKDFSREESRDECEDVDLNKMVEQGLRLLQNIIKNRTDRFILEVEEDLPKVKGSSQRLEQVLVNLVQNACQALDSREESVTLKIYLDDVRQKILLQVSDEGCGMPENLLEEITDPFFTTRRAEGGTGLGLSVSTRIIEEHSGTMKVNSEPGKGSVFTVELPIANGEHS
jgi:signal transduction histidine kinase